MPKATPPIKRGGVNKPQEVTLEPAPSPKEQFVPARKDEQPPQPDPQEAPQYPVRVVVREVSYARLTTNVVGHTFLQYETAYGPGRPEINPSVRLQRHPDVDPGDAERDFRLGQLIHLYNDDYMRLKPGGAVDDAETVERKAEEPDVEVLDAETASVEDLTRWISQEHPSAEQVVQASGGDPQVANKLLKAEAQAAQETNGEPRQPVVDGLVAVVSRG